MRSTSAGIASAPPAAANVPTGRCATNSSLMRFRFGHSNRRCLVTDPSDRSIIRHAGDRRSRSSPSIAVSSSASHRALSRCHECEDGGAEGDVPRSSATARRRGAGSRARRGFDAGRARGRAAVRRRAARRRRERGFDAGRARGARHGGCHGDATEKCASRQVARMRKTLDFYAGVRRSGEMFVISGKGLSRSAHPRGAADVRSHRRWRRDETRCARCCEARGRYPSRGRTTPRRASYATTSGWYERNARGGTRALDRASRRSAR